MLELRVSGLSLFGKKSTRDQKLVNSGEREVAKGYPQGAHRTLFT